MNRVNSISIIIPVYNAERYLNRCLFSLKEKNAEDEIILINDGSKDGSEAICKEFKKQVDNVILINQSNSGVSAARNTGIMAAHNKWVVFVDADDYLIEGWRNKIDRILSKEGALGDVLIFAQDICSKTYDKDQCIASALGFYDADFVSNSLSWVVSKLYCRQTIIENNIHFLEGLINGEDMLFNSAVFASSMKILGIPQSFYCVYKNMESSTNQFNGKIIDAEHIFHEELRVFMKQYQKDDIRWENMYEISLLTGLYAVTYRIALAREKVTPCILEDLINEDEYKNALINLSAYQRKLPKKQLLILKELKKGNIKKAILYAKIICSLKRAYYKKKDNGIITII